MVQQTQPHPHTIYRLISGVHLFFIFHYSGVDFFIPNCAEISLEKQIVKNH